MIEFDRSFCMTIGGELVAGPDMMDVINPATAKPVARAPDCSAAQLEAAIASAGRAFAGWRSTPYGERQAALRKIAERLREHADDLARLMTLEQGKPLRESTADILGSAYWCEATATLDMPEEIFEKSDLRVGKSRRVPIGVVAAIAPWNFPVKLAFFKLAPALLAGNTVLLKPSPFTPLTTLKIGELLRDLLPPGVLNIVSGRDRLGPWLTAHPGISKISFTGSTATGRRVLESAAPSLKRVTLELGGNDAAIIMPDVDIQSTAEKIFWAAFRNSGQVCIAAKRIYIHSDIYAPMCRAIEAVADRTVLGNGLDPQTELGPVQNVEQFERIKSLIEDCRSNGYRFLRGEAQSAADGYFISPILLDNPPDDSKVVVEEQFGPILPLLKFHSIEEAVARANASEFGLGASVWSKDLDVAEQIASQLQVGTIWINEAHYLTPLGAFGGHKQSGIGVEGARDGLLEYTNSQTVFTRQ